MVSYKLNAERVDWESDESYLFVNPRLGEAKQKLIKLKEIPDEPEMVWIASSGTTAASVEQVRLLGLKKSAFLLSARAVCDHIGLKPTDIWLNVLPRYHVGGLSIEARSFVGKFSFVNQKLSPFTSGKLISAIDAQKATIISLVPTQIFEIVKKRAKAPKSIRIVLVGGGALSDSLYEKALALGWPLILTYGMTEVCSQIATEQTIFDNREKKPESLPILPHVKCKMGPTGQLMISSESLFWGEIIFNSDRVIFKKQNQNWYTTRDIVELLPNNHLRFLARESSTYKISGELVNLDELSSRLNSIVFDLELETNFPLMYLNVTPNIKYGYQVDLFVEGFDFFSDVEALRNKFNSLVAPFERIKNIYFLNEVEQTSLGKVIKNSFFKS